MPDDAARDALAALDAAVDRLLHDVARGAPIRAALDAFYAAALDDDADEDDDDDAHDR